VHDADELISSQLFSYIQQLHSISANHSPNPNPNPGKTTESDRHHNPTTNPNPNPYLVAVRYGSFAQTPPLHKSAECTKLLFHN